MSQLDRDLQEVTELNFESEVLESTTPVLVDFWAEWCGPCRMIMPWLKELKQEKPDIKIVKLNIDAHPSIATQYGIRSIPTMIIFSAGKALSTKIGAASKQSILEWIIESCV